MSTKNGAVLSTQIVPEVLINKENYEEWSIRLRTYLMAQDVWDVLEPTPTFVDVWDVAVEMAWKRKNATALHAIHISCGPDAVSLIEHITNAKEAWDKLAESMVMAGPEPLIQAAIQENAISTDWVRQLEPLYNAVQDGDYNATKQIIETNPGVARARITFSRRTALHVAAMAGHMSIVKLLVQAMFPKDLEITDDDGFTALAVAIISNATRSIAECMVTKNARILTNGLPLQS
ncbi:uncharacterized protein LOC125421520 isoform X2 [Ziziphus jujuba]|nr:uncharacterized protein LOC125421520 isoform X2 [Ziziphus jujuba]